jgi:hypothetical protein
MTNKIRPNQNKKQTSKEQNQHLSVKYSSTLLPAPNVPASSQPLSQQQQKTNDFLVRCVAAPPSKLLALIFRHALEPNTWSQKKTNNKKNVDRRQ